MPQILEPRVGTLSRDLVRIVTTSSDTQSPITTTAGREKWQQIVRTLEDWLQDPSQLADDGLEPPNGTIIRLGLDISEQMRDRGYPAPDRIVPDPNGGIALEINNGQRL